MQVYFDFNFSNQKHMIKLNSQLQGSPVASAPAPNTYGTPQATPAQPAPDNYGSPQGSAIGTGGGSGFNAFVGGTPNSNFQTSSQGTKNNIVVIPNLTNSIHTHSPSFYWPNFISSRNNVAGFCLSWFLPVFL